MESKWLGHTVYEHQGSRCDSSSSFASGSRLYSIRRQQSRLINCVSVLVCRIYFTRGEGYTHNSVYLRSYVINKKIIKKIISRGGWGVYIFKKLLHKYNSLMILFSSSSLLFSSSSFLLPLFFFLSLFFILNSFLKIHRVQITTSLL